MSSPLSSLVEADPNVLPLILVEVEIEVLLLSPPPVPREARPSRSRTRSVGNKKEFDTRWAAIWPGKNAAALMETLRDVRPSHGKP